MHNAQSKWIEEIRRIGGVDTKKCMKCGKCSASCPAYAKMDVPPHRFVALADGGHARAMMDSQAVWNCLSCFTCVERCPRGVEPARIIEAARLCLIRQQGRNHIQPEEIPALLDDDLPQQALVSAFRKYAK